MESIVRESFVVVAAANSGPARQSADYVCTGSHDELTIQKAIDRCAAEDKNLYLLNGTYELEGFYDRGDVGPLCALCVPNIRREITILGQNSTYGKQGGVVMHIPAHALDTIGEKDADVLRTGWCDKGLSSGGVLRMENIMFCIAHNQQALRCIDLRRCDRPELKNIRMNCYADMNAGFGKPPAVPAEGCIGLTMTDGSNAHYSNYTNVSATGFYEGIQVGGEHVVLINCAAIMCAYGYTFGNYKIKCGANHPIIMINCMDERNIHLPLFNSCGDSDGKGTGNRLQGGQEVTMISFNIERLAEQTPGQVLGDLMKEVYPGTWRGNIDFTAQPAWHHTNEPAFQLWENDGSGSGFQTRNVVHKKVCTTAERLSYYPMLGQQIFDTDLGKMVICTDPAKRKWVDMNGQAV